MNDEQTFIVYEEDDPISDQDIDLQWNSVRVECGNYLYRNSFLVHLIHGSGSSYWLCMFHVHGGEGKHGPWYLQVALHTGT